MKQLIVIGISCPYDVETNFFLLFFFLSMKPSLTLVDLDRSQPSTHLHITGHRAKKETNKRLARTEIGNGISCHAGTQRGTKITTARTQSDFLSLKNCFTLI